MRTSILLALLMVAFTFAQQPVPTPLPPSLATYLDLTATQSARLVQNRVELQRFLAEKSRREVVVRTEIAAEIQKPSLDPMALGLRYVELEAICRESQAAYAQNQRDNQAVLTDGQRTRLRGLEEVMRLIPVVNEAQSLGLLPGGGSGIIPVLGGPTGSGLIGGIGTGSIAELLLGNARSGPGCSAGGFSLGGLIGFGSVGDSPAPAKP